MPDLVLVLRVLVVLLLLAALLWCLPIVPLHRWRMRRYMVAQLDPDLSPDQRAQALAHIREMIPLRGKPKGATPAPPPLPGDADPTELRFDVEIPPTPDGCPGVRLRVPWLSTSAPAAAPSGADGSRQPVSVLLGDGRALLVVVLGRVGQVNGGGVLAGARDRPHVFRVTDERSSAVGDVLRADTAAGPASRHTFEVGLSRVTDTHVDHDGWAFVVGVMRRSGDTHVDGLDDAVLATWRWLPADAAPVTAAGVVAPPGRLVVVGHDGAPAATCRAPGAPAELVAAGVPCPDGAWTAAYVRLTATASLVVTSAPLDPARDARTALEQPERVAWGPRVEPTGPVRERATPAGTLLTRTTWFGGVVRTEARLDREGRAWRWILTYLPDERGVLAVLDDALMTWRWEDPRPEEG